MKTIRLIVLAALLLPALVSQAQTKEETIAWLKEKLGNYLIISYIEDETSKNFKLESINECEIVITYEVRLKGNSNFEWIRQTFPTIGWKIDKSGTILFNSDVVKYTCESCTKVYHSSSVDEVKIENREDKIYERIQKAIDHLATFCPKAKEAF